ncbi:hypothetical protein Hdeb2414_s0021g00579601 [Helianthus debilis subsp. tardiflorus]
MKLNFIALSNLNSNHSKSHNHFQNAHQNSLQISKSVFHIIPPSTQSHRRWFHVRELLDAYIVCSQNQWYWNIACRYQQRRTSLNPQVCIIKVV